MQLVLPPLVPQTLYRHVTCLMLGQQILEPPVGDGPSLIIGRTRLFTIGDIAPEEIFYKPGKFLNASLDKASEENERNYYKIKTEKGDHIIIVQIAGLIARRIVCETIQNQSLKQGERIGMIRFGSRVDIYFNNRKLLAKVGQNVVAGESFIAIE